MVILVFEIFKDKERFYESRIILNSLLRIFVCYYATFSKKIMFMVYIVYWTLKDLMYYLLNHYTECVTKVQISHLYTTEYITKTFV